MLRVLPALIELGLLIYALVDCIQTPDKAVRNLPRWAWLILIILLPYGGPIAWLIAGRPLRSGSTRPGGVWPSSGYGGSAGGSGGSGGSGRPGRYGGAPRGPRGAAPSRPVIGPDDDPDFLRGLNRPADDKDDPPA